MRPPEKPVRGDSRPCRYGLLHPSPRSDSARRENDALLGPATLGIEVTVPALARCCGLGNVDPQHDGGADSRAAIESCLEHPTPPPGAFLVTVRPDLDALGAMALLSLRRTNDRLGADLRARVAAIGVMDRFARGPWPGPRRLPATHQDHLDLLSDGAAGLAGPIAVSADRDLPLNDRVALIAAWLSAGSVPDAYARAGDAHAAALMRAIVTGSVTVRPVSGGAVAALEGSAPGALRLGYCLAPVVVALDPAFRFRNGPPHRKFTIAQYVEGHVDLAGLAACLAVREPGWGGSRTIIGSPQGAGSALRLDEVIDAVLRHQVPRR
jgi:hypothetical protein